MSHTLNTKNHNYQTESQKATVLQIQAMGKRIEANMYTAKAEQLQIEAEGLEMEGQFHEYQAQFLLFQP